MNKTLALTAAVLAALAGASRSARAADASTRAYVSGYFGMNLDGAASTASFAGGNVSDDASPSDGLSQAGSAWLAWWVAAERRSALSSSCSSAGAAAPKKACSDLKDRLETALDALEPAVETTRSREDEAREARQAQPAAGLKDGWPAAGAPEGFGKGVEKLVHWYYRRAGAELDAAVKEYDADRRAKARLDQDLEDALQLGLSKADRKAKSKESDGLADALSKLDDKVKAAGKKLKKGASSDLDAWAGRLKKDFKADLSRKDLCSCP